MTLRLSSPDSPGAPGGGCAGGTTRNTNPTSFSLTPPRAGLAVGGTEFFANLDRRTKPALEQSFLEIKSRTWSRGDAEEKSALILELLKVLGAGKSEVIPDEYPG